MSISYIFDTIKGDCPWLKCVYALTVITTIIQPTPVKFGFVLFVRKSFMKRLTKTRGVHMNNKERYERIREIEKLVSELHRLLKKHGGKLNLETNYEITEVASQLDQILTEYNNQFMK